MLLRYTWHQHHRARSETLPSYGTRPLCL